MRRKAEKFSVSLRKKKRDTQIKEKRRDAFKSGIEKVENKMGVNEALKK